MRPNSWFAPPLSPRRGGLLLVLAGTALLIMSNTTINPIAITNGHHDWTDQIRWARVFASLMILAGLAMLLRRRA